LMKAKIRKGIRKKRRQRPVQKNVPANYDSIWEANLHGGLLKKWKHHSKILDYTIKHKYHPDFIRKIGRTTYLIEAKGRFWDFAEYSKYIWINKSLPRDYELIFLFADPAAPMPQAKRRKDGTKRSHAEWAEANGFTWYSEYTLPDEWVDMEYRKSEGFINEYFDENKETE